MPTLPEIDTEPQAHIHAFKRAVFFEWLVLECRVVSVFFPRRGLWECTNPKIVSILIQSNTHLMGDPTYIVNTYIPHYTMRTKLGSQSNSS